MKKNLWLLMLPLFILFFIPKNTFALTLTNPRMEIWGTIEGSDTVTELIGCTACNSLQNVTGRPSFIRVYIPKNIITSYYEYDITWAFRWETNSSFNVWPLPPTFYYLGEPIEEQTQLDWKNTFENIYDGVRARENYFATTFVAPYMNIIDESLIYLDMPISDHSGQSSNLDYSIIFASFDFTIVTKNGGEVMPDYIPVIDNAKNDIINNQNIHAHANQENFDKIQESITSDNVTGSQGFAKDFFNNFKDDDNNGISSIVKAPLVMIEALISDSDSSRCSNVNFDILGKSVYFPSGCTFWSKVPDSVRSIYYLIICGFFGYKLVVSLFKDVQHLKSPSNSGVTTLDL